MTVAKRGVGAPAMTKPLGAGPTPGKTGIARIGERCAHELVRAAGLLAVAEDDGLGGVKHVGGFCGLFDVFPLAVADVAGVVIVAGEGIVEGIRAAVEGG